jgi:acyl-CoA oxidase
MENKSIKAVLDEKLSSVNSNTRKILSETFKDKVFTPVYDISLRDQKELAYDRLKKVMEAKPCSVRDFQTDPNNIFTMHEMVSYFFY